MSEPAITPQAAIARPGGAVTGLTGAILVSLGAVAALGPISSDAFLPGLPAIVTEFGAPAAQVQLTLSGLAIGLGVGQLLAGPASDAAGRRVPLIIGVLAAVVAAVVAMLAPSLTVLTVACVVIGAGASFGMVIARAIVSDLAMDGHELTRGFSLLNTVIAVGPVIAPLIGAALMAGFGWRGVFGGIAGISLIAVSAIVMLVPETLPRAQRVMGGLRAIPPTIAMAVRSRAYLSGAFVIWLAFAASWAYISGSSYLVQGILGFSPTGYAITFAANGVGLVVAGMLAARLARRLGNRQIMAVGLVALSVGAGFVLMTALTGVHTAWLLLPGLFLLAASIGLYVGPGLALAVTELRHAAGTVLATIGAVQFVIAGIVSPIVGIGGGRDLVSFTLVVTISTVLAWVAWVVFAPHKRQA